MTADEAAQAAHEERTGETPALHLICPPCGVEWRAWTRWGDVLDPRDGDCPVCGAEGEPL